MEQPWCKPFLTSNSGASSPLTDTVAAILSCKNAPKLQPVTTREEMCGPPTSDEVLTALSKIKVGKAAGSNSLKPDIKCCGGSLLDFIVPLFDTLWREK